MQIKLKSALFTVLIGFAVVALLSSCDKSMDEPLMPVISNEIQSTTTPQGTQMRALSDIAKKAYKVDPKYKEAYVHQKQGRYGCGPLNYVLCMRAIIRGNNSQNNYAPNITVKYNHVVTSGGGTGLTVDQLTSYFNDNDSLWGISTYPVRKSHSQQQEITEAMIYQLADNKKPFLFLGAAWSNNQNQYVGHYYIVWNVTWNGSLETSDIYVTDTRDLATSFDNQIKRYRLKDFLDLGANNPDASNYWLMCFF